MEQSGKIIVIGTPATARSACASVLALGSGAPAIVGCVLLGPARRADGADLPVPMLGGLDRLASIAESSGAREALVSLPLAATELIEQVRASLRGLRMTERFLPTTSDVLAFEPATFTSLRPELDLAALIGREPRPVDRSRVDALIGGKRVLITGAGGSIGSELARFCAGSGATELVLVDRSENSLFEIDRQMRERFPDVARRTVLHDVVNADATRAVVSEASPDLVFHAAAHKHVPMMEEHPAAAIENNVLGTVSIADASIEAGVERVVLVSTDKAVHPTSIMGATKQLAERYIRSRNRVGSRTVFGLVRFGNVLGSACSVLPIWSAQLAAGGPITITDPEMTRYFMTIPEAASLVVQAASLLEHHADASSSDVFVLDMGAPVRIGSLVDRFLQAHGVRGVWPGDCEDTDVSMPSVEILVTGHRPGEKMHEELAHQGERLGETGVDGILAWSGPSQDPNKVDLMIRELMSVRDMNGPERVLEVLRRHAPVVMVGGPESGRVVAA